MSVYRVNKYRNPSPKDSTKARRLTQKGNHRYIINESMPSNNNRKKFKYIKKKEK